MKIMKAKIIFILMFTFGLGNISAQQFNLVPVQKKEKKEYDWKNMSSEQRKKIINEMAPEERAALLREFREKMILAEMNISPEKQEEFKALYSEYLDKQGEIKKKFKNIPDYESLSEEEAKKQLAESFNVGQQLLNNRKEYSEKFMKIIPPQKVLKLYDTEGMIRHKMMDMKNDGEKPKKKR